MIIAPINCACMQTNFVHENPLQELDDTHISKLIVYFTDKFKKSKPELFIEKDDSVPGPKVKHKQSEMLGLYVFATFRGNKSCRKIEEFLSDKSAACKYITNNKPPKKSLINDFKNTYEYLIDEFFKYTVKLGFNFKLVDFKVVSIDSTPIEAHVNEYRSLSIAQVTYLEDLIIDYSFNKSTRPVWNKIKRYFYNDELPSEMIELIDEIYHNLNKYGRELLQVALYSQKSRDNILGVILELKENYDGSNNINLTDSSSRKMHMKNGTKRFAYLLQTVKDVKTGFTIMQKVVQDKTDRYQLKPAIDYIIETYNMTPEYILADNGYYGLDQIEYAYSKGIIPVIPDRNDAMKTNGTKNDNGYAKCNWPFNPRKLTFTCPYNQELTVQGVKVINDVLNLVFRTHACPECPYKKECAKNNKYRTLYEPFNPYFFDRKEIFLSNKGKMLYKLRAIHSEGGFNELKHIQKFDHSDRVGIEKVEIDLKLETIVSNLKKLRTHLNVTLI